MSKQGDKISKKSIAEMTHDDFMARQYKRREMQNSTTVDVENDVTSLPTLQSEHPARIPRTKKVRLTLTKEAYQKSEMPNRKPVTYKKKNSLENKSGISTKTGQTYGINPQRVVKSNKIPPKKVAKGISYSLENTILGSCVWKCQKLDRLSDPEKNLLLKKQGVLILNQQRELDRMMRLVREKQTLLLSQRTQAEEELSVLRKRLTNKIAELQKKLDRYEVDYKPKAH